MKLISFKSKTDKDLDCVFDYYKYDDLLDKDNLRKSIDYFSQNGYELGGSTIYYEYDHADDNQEYNCNNLEELYERIKRTNLLLVENIEIIGSIDDNIARIGICPQSSTVVVELSKKKEIEEQKQM